MVACSNVSRHPGIEHQDTCHHPEACDFTKWNPLHTTLMQIFHILEDQTFYLSSNNDELLNSEAIICADFLRCLP